MGIFILVHFCTSWVHPAGRDSSATLPRAIPERILPASTAPGDARPPAPLQVLLGKWEQLIAPGKGEGM